MDVVKASSREKPGRERSRAESRIQGGFNPGGWSERVLANVLQEFATGSAVVRGETLTGCSRFREDEQLVFEEGNRPKEGRMIDAFIIEELKRREREEEQRRENERPFLELPLPMPEVPMWPSGNEEDPKPERGVVVIDFGG